MPNLNFVKINLIVYDASEGEEKIEGKKNVSKTKDKRLRFVSLM